MNKFQKLTQDKDIKDTATQIYDTFIASGGLLELNIDNKKRKLVLNDLQAPTPAMYDALQKVYTHVCYHNQILDRKWKLSWMTPFVDLKRVVNFACWKSVPKQISNTTRNADWHKQNAKHQ